MLMLPLRYCLMLIFAYFRFDIFLLPPPLSPLFSYFRRDDAAIIACLLPLLPPLAEIRRRFTLPLSLISSLIRYFRLDAAAAGAAMSADDAAMMLMLMLSPPLTPLSFRYADAAARAMMLMPATR